MLGRAFAQTRPLLSRASKVASARKAKVSSQDLIDAEAKFAAHNYHPLPVVFAKAKGCVVTDPEGREYYDFLSAYSAVNQGHGHPKILNALMSQAKKLALSSRAFYNDMFPRYAEHLTKMFKYESMLPANTGVEAVEGALKLVRKWGADVKKIPDGQQITISACGCFHGRTIGAISMSCDPEAFHGFGPLAPGNVKVPFDDLEALEAALKQHHEKTCAVVIEPIQGEAGVYVPKDGYLKGVADLCKKYNVLFVADEIQTGLGRTGKMLAVNYEPVRPDVVILGKALGGGVYPVSAVLADKAVMKVFTPGTHGSTFGGNPLAAAIAIASLDVIVDEKLTENAFKMGEYLRDQLNSIKSPIIQTVRGKGLLNAIVVKPNLDKSAWDVCLLLKHRGLLAKPTHDHIIRLAPPLIITKTQLNECVRIIKSTFEDIVSMDRKDIPFASPTLTHHDAPTCQKCGRKVP